MSLPAITAEESFRGMLRATESIKATLDVVMHRHVVTTEEDEVQLPLRAEDTRILAVVAHKDDRHDFEQGSIFICIPANHDKTTQDLDVERIIPLLPDFSTTLAQTKQSMFHHGHVKRTSHKVVSGFSLTIHPGNTLLDLEFDLEPASFFTQDVKALRLFVKECRELTITE
ncbi:hypothetical protein H0H93_003938, partial [Arthromyces matolae]